jgi:VIT1/CCC1 family predicted Fe2+/Mn2+ transporter
VLPFFFVGGLEAVAAALALSGLALFAIGAATSFFTGRGVLFSGVRQLLIGYAASAVTYGIGHVIGVTVGG